MILCKNVVKPDFQLTCAPGTYLYSICKYKWKDALKKQNQTLSFDPQMEVVSTAQADHDAYEQKEWELKKLDHVLQQVGKKYLGLLKSYYFDRQSMREIAKRYGFGSKASAKTQKYKCLQRAKPQLS